MKGPMYERMKARRDEWVQGRREKSINGAMNEGMKGRMYERRKGQNRCLDGGREERQDEKKKGSIPEVIEKGPTNQTSTLESIPIDRNFKKCSDCCDWKICFLL